MRIIPLAILCALVGLTYWVGATAFTSKIQQDISTRTNEAIASYKPAVDLVVDGRDVTLTGTVRDNTTREAALNTVDSVYGVRATRDQLSLMERYDLYGKFSSGNHASMRGHVDADSHTEIIESFPALKNRTNLKPDARSLLNSAGKIALAATAIDKMNEAELWMDEEQLKITGVAPDDMTRAKIRDYLNQRKSTVEPLELVTNISVPAVPKKCLTSTNPDQVRRTLLFEVDSDLVREEYLVTLNDFSDLIRDCVVAREGSVVVEAHADHDGSEEYNLDLSRRRAEEVAKLLHSNGLPASEVNAFAFGETRPVASNETSSNKAYNRRVEVRFIEASKQPGKFNQTIISTQSAE